MSRLLPLGLVALTSLALIGVAPMAKADIEEPAYRVMIRDGAFEVRRYAPMIVAEVEVSGDFGSAGNRGFNPLADYIFGNNTRAGKIAMTAPVSQQRTGEKIAMTAPVSQSRAGDRWRVQFTMPAGYTMATLPKPVNPDVQLQEVPPRTMAVIRFSGLNSDNVLRAKEQELRAFAQQKGLRLTGSPIYARYDPPWTPPFLRRNEIQMAVDDSV